MSSPAARNTLMVPFGRFTRFMLAGYVRHTLIVAFALLVIALTIDLSPRLARITASGPDGTLGAALHLAWYIGLRSTDILARLLPIACFFGVLWSEINTTLTRERLSVWSGGRSPEKSLAPVLIFAVLFGGAQFTLDTWLRPAAVTAQIDGQLGDYGERFSRDLSPTVRWIAADNDLVSARIAFGPPVALRDVTIYRLDPEGRLALITWARTAAPKSANEWVLGEGSQWVRTDGPAGGRRIAGTQSDFADLTYTLNIDPLWLSHFGIWAKLLPQSTLSILAAPHSSFYIPNEYQTWVQVRIAQAFFPGALALLACGLSFVWLSYSVSVVSLFGVALTGYMAHVFMKIFVIFGERAFLAPVLSAWTIPLLVLAVAAAHFVSMRLRYGGGLLPRLRGPQARNETAVSGG